MTTPELCTEFQALQRQRAIVLKSRNMQANRLQALVAGTLGYKSTLTEKERAKLFKEASRLIKAIVDHDADNPLREVVLTTRVGIDAFEQQKKDLEKRMTKMAKQLPVAEWVEQPEQRGFGMLFLAIVIGETGDLNNYPNPAKVWKRLGCAPWTFDGKTKMGATWRSGREGKLPAEEWERFGYSPRRRSIAYLIGEGIVKQNFLSTDSKVETECTCGAQSAVESCLETEARCDCNHSERNGQSDIDYETDDEIHPGPYRLRYNNAKATFAEKHPDYTPKRRHLHGMLVATKLLLKNLWIEWTCDASTLESETPCVAACK